MDFSDLSDFTALSSDDDQFTRKGGKAKSKSKETNNGYVLKNALKAPRNVQYSTKFLYEQVIDNRIDLNPEYQRDIVWPEAKQSGLIDSVLRNYYVPPVIFSVNVHSDGTETRTCIDGKQRLTSIQRFFDGMICHKDSFTNQKLWFKRGGRGTNHKLLPPQYKAHFESKQITCIEYDNLTDDQEREMFQRVQLGVALTPAERLQAITGPFPTLIRGVQNMITSDNGFDNNLEWSSTRGRDFQCIASVVYLIHKIPAQSFPTSSVLDKWLQSNILVEHSLRTAVTETFQRFVSLVRNPQYNAPFNKPTRVSPIEFVMIGLLIFILREKCSDEEISERIREMRTDVRSKHVDIRTNTKVTKTMFAFVNHQAKSSWTKAPPKVAFQVSSATVVKAPTATAGNKKGKRKRKRGESSEDDYDEDDYEVRKPSLPKPEIAITGRQTRVAAEAAAFSYPFLSTPLNASKSTASTNRPASKSTVPTGRKKTAPVTTKNTVLKQEQRSPPSSSTSASHHPSASSSETQLSQSLRDAGTEQNFASVPTHAAQAAQTRPKVVSQSVIKIEPTDFFAAIREAKAQKSKVTAAVPSPSIPGQSGVGPLSSFAGSSEKNRNIATGQIVSAAVQPPPAPSAPSATFSSLATAPHPPSPSGKSSSTLQRPATNSNLQLNVAEPAGTSLVRPLLTLPAVETEFPKTAPSSSQPTTPATAQLLGPLLSSEKMEMLHNVFTLQKPVPSVPQSYPAVGGANKEDKSGPLSKSVPESSVPSHWLRPPQYSPPPITPIEHQVWRHPTPPRNEVARQYRDYSRSYNNSYSHSMDPRPRGPRYNSGGGYYGRERDRGWSGRR